MLKVGEFARLGQVSVRLLHYYDQLGLLSPMYVDRASGYRYYAPDQLERLHRILALKDLGLSLEQIAVLLKGSLSAEELRGMLLIKQAELCQRVAEEQARLDRVQGRLKLIEHVGADVEVVVKAVPALDVLSLRRAIQPLRPPHFVFYQASAVLRERGLREAVTSIQSRYHTRYLMQTYAGVKPGRNLFEAAYGIDPARVSERAFPVEGGGCLRLRQWPAVEMMACTIYRGSDHDRYQAHQALLQWIAMQGYALAGPQREVYLWRAEPDETSDAHVTEIQHPIRKVGVPS
ncbi:MAG TPA: MerR family transcriptional regulator [Phototrophicaceae bacterium]|nr:MerR family transcriptional regulator [Phototrophicaceae bacterium]